MDFITLRFEEWKLILSANVWVTIAFIALIASFFLIRRYIFKKKKTDYKIKEYKIAVGNFEATIECDYLDREIAYKSWVEMNTRKIGLEIDEENDVVEEVYNSWYTFFGVIRENIKNMPCHKLNSCTKLIETLTRIINETMRSHLTKWQAKFRKWYDIEKGKEENKKLSPQEIQRLYPEYTALMKDLKKTNHEMIQLKEELYKIAFDNPKEDKEKGK